MSMLRPNIDRILSIVYSNCNIGVALYAIGVDSLAVVRHMFLHNSMFKDSQNS